MNRRTVERDRVMRTMTYGPRGGMSGLGAVNLGYQGGATSPWTGGVRGGRGLTFDGGQTNVPQPPTQSGGAGTITVATQPVATASRAVMKAVQAMNTASVATVATMPTTSGPTIAPTRVITTKPTTTVVGGGGGAWVPPPKPAITMPVFEPTDIPDVPAASDTSQIKRVAMIGGAVALAAYFLLRKKKAQP